MIDGLAAGELRREVALRLRTALDADQKANAGLDARLLVNEAMGRPSAFPTPSDEPVSADAARLLDDFVRRRIDGEPVARILGRREFWSLSLELSSETLVPRPETETVVEAALAGVGDRRAPIMVLDIGTGSGAILLALLSEMPNAFGVGTDASPGALIVARANARRLRLDDRAAFVASNWGEAIAAPVDLIVCNPPYIPTGEIADLAREVRCHDPPAALDGGADGLEAYRQVVGTLRPQLHPGGRGIFEVGAGQADAVEALGTGCGLAARRHRDLAGIERVVEFFPAG